MLTGPSKPLAARSRRIDARSRSPSPSGGKSSTSLPPRLSFRWTCPIGPSARVIDDVAGVVVDADPVVTDLVEQVDARAAGRHQVRVGLDAETDARRLRLVRERPCADDERATLVLSLRVAGERVEDRDAELGSGAKDVREPPAAELLVE